jgi:hypothetical protein
MEFAFNHLLAEIDDSFSGAQDVAAGKGVFVFTSGLKSCIE